MQKRIKNIDKFFKEPLECQKSVFNYLIKKGRKTKFGNDHNMYKIINYNTFTNQIPVRTYEELYPYIAKIRKGEQSILWPGSVNWFAKSSGTNNNESKYKKWCNG